MSYPTLDVPGQSTGCGTGKGEKEAGAKQSQVKQSNQLLLRFSPFPVRHPVYGPGMMQSVLAFRDSPLFPLRRSPFICIKIRPDIPNREKQ